MLPRTCTGVLRCSGRCCGIRLSKPAYNANVGTHLQTRLINLNQTPTPYLNQFVQQYGADQALALLRADINSPQARAANIPIPYPSFVNQRLGRWRRRCVRSLSIRTSTPAIRTETRAATRLTTLWSSSSTGDMLRPDVQLELCFFQAPDRLRQLLRQHRDRGAGPVQSATREVDRCVRSDPSVQDQHALRAAVWTRQAVGVEGIPQLCHRRLACECDPDLQQRNPDCPARNNPLPINNAQTRPVIDSYDNWRAPIKGDKFDPAVDRFFIPASQFPAQPSRRVR